MSPKKNSTTHLLSAEEVQHFFGYCLVLAWHIKVKALIKVGHDTSK